MTFEFLQEIQNPRVFWTVIITLPIMLWALGIFTTLVHELGHALAGRSQGLRGVQLVIGRQGDGACSFTQTPENMAIFAQPRVRLLVAVGGCLANLVVGSIALAAGAGILEFTRVGFLASTSDMLVFYLISFALMNLATSVGCFIPASGPDQDYTMMRQAWSECRAQGQNSRT